MRGSRERDWTGGRAFDSELRIAPPFALEGRGFVFPALRCHSDRAQRRGNPSFFFPAVLGWESGLKLRILRWNMRGGWRAFDSELRVAPPFAWKGGAFVFPALRCHSDRAQPGAGSTWSPLNKTRNPHSFSRRYWDGWQGLRLRILRRDICGAGEPSILNFGCPVLRCRKRGHSSFQLYARHSDRAQPGAASLGARSLYLGPAPYL